MNANSTEKSQMTFWKLLVCSVFCLYKTTSEFLKSANMMSHPVCITWYDIKIHYLLKNSADEKKRKKARKSLASLTTGRSTRHRGKSEKPGTQTINNLNYLGRLLPAAASEWRVGETPNSNGGKEGYTEANTIYMSQPRYSVQLVTTKLLE